MLSGGTHQGLSLIPALICLGIYIAVIVAAVFLLPRMFRSTSRGGEDGFVPVQPGDLSNQDEINLHTGAK